MNLDDQVAMQALDSSKMIDHINTLPDQIEKALVTAEACALQDWKGIRNVLIAGMGGSAIAGDLVSAFYADSCKVPLFIQRDYDLPAWVSTDTLVIASSHSGNTEETLAVFEAARQRSCPIVVIATGGRLAQQAGQAGFPVWKFEHNGQPRSAVGFGFVLLASILARLGLVPDPAPHLRSAVKAMRSEMVRYLPESPVTKNPAKRQAGQLLGRQATVIGSGKMAPLGRRFKGQINELAKAMAAFDMLPEADHNTLAGTQYPENLVTANYALFLESPSDHPRNHRRSTLTRQSLMLSGFCTDVYKAAGSSPMEQLWTTLHFGDYVAYYLAMLYGVDPTPIDAIQHFKQQLD